jgi:Protein of unknown function (DUF1501)
MTRREALRMMGAGFGTVGLANALPNSLAARAPHFPAKAKHVIFLFLNGGPSQVDTFDPKPMLTKHNGQPIPSGNLKTERKTGNLFASPFKFKKYGQSGIEVSELFPNVGEMIDDVCVIRSMHCDRPTHESSLFMMNTGDNLQGRPSMGSWITYGLGTENQNLPAFVVLCPGFPVIGPQLWSSAFLPAVYQGSYISNSETDPEKLVQFVHNKHLNASAQRHQVDLINQLNRMELDGTGQDPQLEASIQAMEVAFRMQTEAPDVLDIRGEKESLRAQYGDTGFGRGCLMARRLVERGVRVVQVYFGNGQPWDSHEDIEVHRTHAKVADPAIATLLRDLKDRALLDETLVIIGGEFGRTPVSEVGKNVKYQNGRDHNNWGFTVLLAGGGVRKGTVYGATDEFGFKAVERPVHIHDLHATVLNRLGLDHTKLTYRYSGRDFRLTDVEGNVVHDILI